MSLDLVLTHMCSIFLVDHAWTYDLVHAKDHLEQVPGLVDRMAVMMQEAEPDEDSKDECSEEEADEIETEENDKEESNEQDTQVQGEDTDGEHKKVVKEEREMLGLEESVLKDVSCDMGEDSDDEHSQSESQEDRIKRVMKELWRYMCVYTCGQ